MPPDLKLVPNVRAEMRTQLVMTPQLQQAIKILQLSLPELEAIVQGELESNPMLEPLDQSVGETAANNENGADLAPTEGEPLPAEPEAGTVDPAAEWEPGPVETPEQPLMAEAPDAAAEIQDPGIEKLDWREYLETYQNNWQDGETQNDEERQQAMENRLTRRTSLEDHLMWQLRLSALDDDGYLETPVAELATQLETSVERVEGVLKQVQRLDPPGVGARDLRECL